MIALAILGGGFILLLVAMGLDGQDDNCDGSP